ncbi:hypothetical protein G9A89_000774 [Geosiphon pyriformis]|nr:hypothetical protein G9A89_000774 [Geosiphon pyriformis]
MNIETTTSSITFKKKMPKSTFYGPAGGFFSQKKKVVFSNIKHSNDERNIFLSKSGPSDNIYSNIESLSGDDEDVSMSGAIVNTSAVFGSPFSSLNFYINDDEVIIKTLVEVSVKKLFALDINLSAVKKKSAMAKTQLIRKIFSLVNGFGETTTSSKFEGIIRSTFTSEKSMEMATSLVREKGIVINSNLKRQGIHSDQTVFIKKIPMNTPKKIIIAALAELGKIKLIKVQLIGLWQKAVIEFAKSDQTEFLAAK